MTAEPKPFQKATVSAALRAFARTAGPRRFLVADETGLGKTVVAQSVVQGMMRKAEGPLRVFYICSSLPIAAQNLPRLVGFLPEAERKAAMGRVDRPTLLPIGKLPSHDRLQVFALTPDTALPARNSQGRTGRAAERALLRILLEGVLDVERQLESALLDRAGKERFRDLVALARAALEKSTLRVSSLRDAFRRSLRDTLGLEAGQQLPRRVGDLMQEEGHAAFVARARSALALAALEQIQPDLVVMDEFQRFRDMVSDAGTATANDTEGRLLRAIRGDGDTSRPALLLLSATPYELYRGHGEEHTGRESADFFDLVRFLYGPRSGQAKARTAEERFGVLSDELRKGTPLSQRASEARAELEDMLRRVLSRTERPVLGPPGRQADSARSEWQRSSVPASLSPVDAHVLNHMRDSLAEGSRDWLAPLWQSVPLPMQTLGSRYQAWKNATRVPLPPPAGIAPAQRRRIEAPAEWQHPALRALLREMPPTQMAAPWIGPSVPWWKLGGRWARQDRRVDGKLLVFSRFRAVPPALSGLLSYALEAHLLTDRRRGGRELEYDEVTRQHMLAPSPDRPGLAELFHPAPLLCGLEPLARRRRDLSSAREAVAGQLRGELRRLGVRVVNPLPRARMRPWQLMLALEGMNGTWRASADAWRGILPGPGASGRGGDRTATLHERWSEAASVATDAVDEHELGSLVSLALESPAICLLRALRRHWPAATEACNQRDVVSLCWQGLRSFFDDPCFAAAVGASERERLPAAIRQAVVQGGLEAVLDEHFWYLSATGIGTWSERLRELEKALRLRTSSVAMHEDGPGSQQMRLRCHVAVPLTEKVQASSTEAASEMVQADGTDAGGADDQAWRPEDVRRAFNGPFWPHVLVTTSVGQEGLDLHPWCQTVAHWDLCSNPVAFEQREGRVNRFAGLLVRRAIAATPAFSDRSFAEAAGRGPWTVLAALAEREAADVSGLQPWWSVPGAAVRRLLFEIPGGERASRYAALARARAVYRLVLGMPDQADLLDLLAAREHWSEETVRAACLQLSAFHQGSEPPDRTK